MARPEKAREIFTTTGEEFISFPTEPHAHSILFLFRDYSYKTRTQTQGTLNSRGFVDAGYSFEQGSNLISGEISNRSGIELPFPKQLQDSTSLQLNGFEQSAVTAAITEYLTDKSKGTETFDDLAGAAKGIAGDLAEFIQSAGGAVAGAGLGSTFEKIKSTLGKLNVGEAATGAAYLLRSFLPGDLAKSVDTVTGNVVNPKETLAFSGVDLKTHSFSWEMFPYSETDSQRIKGIVNLLKRKSLPTTGDVTLGTNTKINRVFLNYPSLVDIYLLGVDPSHYPTFKPCMIKSVNVDYGPGGSTAFMKGGRPAGITLSMELMETVIHTAEDIPAGEFIMGGESE